MITIFDEPAIASPSLLGDVEETDALRNAYANLIADDAIAGKPLSSFYAEAYAEHNTRRGRLLAALSERIRRGDARRAASKAVTA